MFELFDDRAHDDRMLTTYYTYSLLCVISWLLALGVHVSARHASELIRNRF